MALIKFGMVVTDARGKLGGQVFSKNKGGAYVRTKVTPVNAQTAAQTSSRQLLSQFSSAWKALTQAQRDSWNAAAPNFPGTNVFGDAVVKSGKNLYTRLNVNLSLIGSPTLNEPPVPAEVASAGIQSVLINTVGGSSVIGTTQAATGSSVIIRATAGMSPGIGNFKNRLRVILAGANGSATAFPIQTELEAKFGAPLEGEKVGVSIVFVNSTTGQASAPVSSFGIAQTP